MSFCRLPNEWQDAFRRDLKQKPARPDPLPERRLARLLAAFVLTGLFYMALPGTVLGVWNLVGISSQRELAAVPVAWIQAHGHAQFFGWVGTFIIGISLYTLPKFRGSVCRSIPLAWVMWAMWSTGIGLRWVAGVQLAAHRFEFGLSAALEFAVAALLVGQVTPKGPKNWQFGHSASFTGRQEILRPPASTDATRSSPGSPMRGCCYPLSWISQPPARACWGHPVMHSRSDSWRH